MAVKPEAEILKIKERIIKDLVTDLSFQFAFVPENSAPFRLRIFGDLPYGNREIIFDKKRREAAKIRKIRGHDT